jgi:hypothetical protein
MLTVPLDYASRDFKWSELACPCCGLKNIDGKAIDTLQDLRDGLRKPLKVNSGCRCTKHNAEVGGQPSSRHLGDQGQKSDAFDISIKGWTSYEVNDLVDLAIKLGFKGIGTAKSFIHIDRRSYYATWTY